MAEDGRIESARRHLRKAIALDADYADAVFNLARLEFIQSAPITLSINLLFSIGMLVLHQTAPSLQWFGFRNPRQVRGSLWGLSILVIAFAEMLMPLPRR